MKTKLLLQTPAAIFLLIATLAASAQPAPRIDPTTGLPVGTSTLVIDPPTGQPVPGVATASAIDPRVAPAPVLIDPNTGLPMATPAEPQWLDPNWSDPPIVLTNINYDGLPLSEVARDLRERFKNYFDILPMPHTFDNDWGSQINVQLQLKDVKASDVFNAMNLVFENDRTPVRWELKAAGNRPLVQLRVLPEGAPAPQPAQIPQPELRRVFFVGDLLNKAPGSLPVADQMGRFVDAIGHVLKMSDALPDNLSEHLQIYEPAQLIVVHGTREQMDLVQQTLLALKQKAALGDAGGNTAESTPKVSEPKPSGVQKY